MRAALWFLAGLVRDPVTHDASGARIAALIFTAAATYGFLWGVTEKTVTESALAACIGTFVAAGAVALYLRSRPESGPSDE